MFDDVTHVLVWVLAGVAVIEGVGLVHVVGAADSQPARGLTRAGSETDDLCHDVNGPQSLNSGGGRDVVKTLWDTANLFLKDGHRSCRARLDRGVGGRGQKSSGRT